MLSLILRNNVWSHINTRAYSSGEKYFGSLQAHSQDFQKGGYIDIWCTGMHACGSGGMVAWKIMMLWDYLCMRPFWDRSRTVVATSSALQSAEDGNMATSEYWLAMLASVCTLQCGTYSWVPHRIVFRTTTFAPAKSCRAVYLCGNLA